MNPQFIGTILDQTIDLENSPGRFRRQNDLGIDDSYAARKIKIAAEKAAEEEAIAIRAHETWKKGFIFPGFLIVVGLPILGWAWNNKRKLDNEKLAKAELATNGDDAPAES